MTINEGSVWHLQPMSGIAIVVHGNVKTTGVLSSQWRISVTLVTCYMVDEINLLGEQ